MNHQELLLAYAFPYKAKKNPKVAGKILSLMYTSNQKYFSLQEIQSNIKCSIRATSIALEQFVNSGEIRCVIPKETDQPYLFYLNVSGLVSSLLDAIKDNKVFTELLEKVIAARDDSNEELNQFIRKSIVFNSEVTDFIDQRIKEYFTDKVKNK